MKAAQDFGKNTLKDPWKNLLAASSPELKLVAITFAELQEARHQADYDLSRPLSHAEASDLVQRAENATAAWKAIRKSGLRSRSYSLEVRVFLAALLVHNNVSRRCQCGRMYRGQETMLAARSGVVQVLSDNQHAAKPAAFHGHSGFLTLLSPNLMGVQL